MIQMVRIFTWKDTYFIQTIWYRFGCNWIK